MHIDLWQPVRVLVSFFLITIFAVPPSLLAQAHLVTPSDLQKVVTDTSQARQQNIEKVREFFSSKAAEKALRSARMNPEQVKNAVATLSDAELAQLASRIDKAHHDLAAGNLNDRDLIIILILLAALILIIVAVR
ncbi:MAG TPA: PA2779 family protein [Terriglobales bacterium]|nr:PA2779 family protein [Terriglobales bacterium]